MDYEKKYKESMAKMTAFLKKHDGFTISSDGEMYKELQGIFPELAESEDERVRNEIISMSETLGKKEWIAWLEKQGELRQDTNYPKFDFNDVMALQCCMETAKKVQKDNELYEKLNSLHGKVYDAYQIKKQGEQKYIPKYKIGDYVKNTNYEGEPIYEIVYMDKECYICEYRGKERMGDKAVMHFSFDNPYLRLVQKPTDKAEPKFHKGDWVVTDKNNVVQIKAIEDSKYVLENTMRFSVDYVDKCWKKWTIQEAKDGDVLFAKNFDNIGGCIFLFNGIDNWNFIAEGDKEVVIGYCCANIIGSCRIKFSIQGPDCVEVERVSPATKEERDTLMKAMADAGYTFDFEKKELKKNLKE